VEVLVAENAATPLAHAAGIHREFLLALVAVGAEHRFTEYFHQRSSYSVRYHLKNIGCPYGVIRSDRL
jgi:hypothetical protein